MDKVIYKQKKYPVRTFTITSEETGEVTYTIAEDALFEAISKNDKHESDGSVENKIDNEIYFYVEDGKLELPAEEICKDCLDIEFKFISEEN